VFSTVPSYPDHRDADSFHRHNIVNFGCGHMTLEQEAVTFSSRPGTMRPPMNAGDPHRIDIERIGVPRNSVVLERR